MLPNIGVSSFSLLLHQNQSAFIHSRFTRILSIVHMIDRHRDRDMEANSTDR